MPDGSGRKTSVKMNLWHAFLNESGVFSSPKPNPLRPSSRIRRARPVKSLPLETRQKPSKRRVYSKSIAWMIIVLPVAFFPLV